MAYLDGLSLKLNRTVSSWAGVDFSRAAIKTASVPIKPASAPKVCHIIQSASGGSARVMLDLVTQMGKSGYDVHVIYSPERDHTRFLRDVTRAAPVSINQCAMTRKPGLGDLAAGLRLRRLIKTLGPFDILHAHSSKAGLLTRLFCQGLAKGIVYSPHAFYSMVPGSNRLYAVAERLLATLADKVIAVSNAEASHAADIGIPVRRVVTVPNGVEMYSGRDRRAVRQDLGLSESAKVIGFVGRFDEQKDPLLAVDIADQLREEANTVLFMVGDGDLRQRVEAEIAARGLEGRVVLAGQRDAKALFAAFDCLLCTSRYEGMPVVFLEALAAGVPIVTSDVGGARELINEGYTGTIRMRAADALAKGVRDICYVDRMIADEQSSHCRAQAAEFTLARLSNRTLDVYNSIIFPNNSTIRQDDDRIRDARRATLAQSSRGGMHGA